MQRRSLRQQRHVFALEEEAHVVVQRRRVRGAVDDRRGRALDAQRSAVRQLAELILRRSAAFQTIAAVASTRAVVVVRRTKHVAPVRVREKLHRSRPVRGDEDVAHDALRVEQLSETRFVIRDAVARRERRLRDDAATPRARETRRVPRPPHRADPARPRGRSLAPGAVSGGNGSNGNRRRRDEGRARRRRRRRRRRPPGVLFLLQRPRERLVVRRRGVASAGGSPAVAVVTRGGFRLFLRERPRERGVRVFVVASASASAAAAARAAAEYQPPRGEHVPPRRGRRDRRVSAAVRREVVELDVDVVVAARRRRASPSSAAAAAPTFRAPPRSRLRHHHSSVRVTGRGRRGRGFFFALKPRREHRVGLRRRRRGLVIASLHPSRDARVLFDLSSPRLRSRRAQGVELDVRALRSRSIAAARARAADARFERLERCEEGGGDEALMT